MGPEYSLSDIASVIGNRNGGFGGDSWAWIIIIVILFVFGRNGFGFGNNGSGAADNYVLASDFSMLSRQLSDGFNSQERKLDSISNGICSLGYDQLNQINGVNMNIAGLGTQLQTCCCNIERSIDGVNYNNAINTNTLQNAMCSNTRDIIDNINCSYRALHDEIVANRIEDKNAQIAAQQNEINALRLAASQERQNNYLVNELRPCPIPAYITCNPFANNGGFFGNCGCGNI